MELYSGNSATDLRPGSQLSVPDTEWHHIAYTRSGSDYDAYLDGHKHDIATLDGEVHNPQYLSFGGTGHLRDGGPVALYEGLLDDVLVMTRGVAQAEVDFMMRGFVNEFAYAPSPGDGADDVLRDHILSWEPGMYAVKHNVYLGIDFDEVSDAGIDSDLLVSQGQADASYDAGALDFGQTYYWRVDEVNAAPDNTIFKGEVWSFTTELFAYPIANVTATSNGISEPGAGVENIVNGSGLNADDQHSVESTDMWSATQDGDQPLTIEFEFDRVHKLHQMLVWNYNVAFEPLLGFGVQDATIEYSADGVDWTVLGDVVLTQATAVDIYTANTTIDFAGAAVKVVKLIVNSAYGTTGKFGLSEVRFLSIPVQAAEPQPADGTADVAIVDATLSWKAGREAATHEVYLSTAPDALTLIDSVGQTTVDPGALDLGTTYYWKVDEVNEAEAIGAWAGDLWSFTTEEFIVVEDFESYTDDIEAGEAIFLTWIDGYEVAGNNSQVGYLEAPFAEETIVHGGGQSMPLLYDNTGGVTASEATRTFATAQDWSTNGVRSLTLSFYGTPDNTGDLYVKINNTQIAYSGDPDNIAVNIWYTWNIDLTTVDGIDNVTSLAIGVAGANAVGMLYIDDIRLSPQDAVVEDWGDELVISAYEWAPEGFLANTPATPDYWGSDLDNTKLSDGIIASDYSGGLCAGWNFSTAGGAFGPTLYFDLESIQSIGAVAIFHQPKYYGFRTVKVSVSSLDNPNRVDITDMADWTGEEIHQSDHWGVGDSGNAPSVMQTVPIRQDGRWVRLQFLSQEPGFDTAWMMFSEFKFYSE